TNVARPRVALERRRPAAAAGAAAATLRAELPGLLAAGGPLQPRLAPRPADALEGNAPALLGQQRVGAAGAPPRGPPRPAGRVAGGPHRRGLARARPGAVAGRRAGAARHAAGPAPRRPVLLTDPVDAGALPVGGHHLSFAASWGARSPSISSATGGSRRSTSA